MRVAVIGAGRSSNGLGPFIAKYFQQAGHDVCAVLTSNPQSAQAAAANLVQYGIKAHPFSDAVQLFHQAKPDIAVIASPTSTHSQMLKAASGCHIFCEKPFIWGPKMLTELEEIFKQPGTIAMNSQWPFSLPLYERLCGMPEKIEKFQIRLSPIVDGRAMILDSAPHALSLLYAACGEGELSNINIDYRPGRMLIKFNYGTCDSTIELVQTPNQPRPFSYGFNDQVISREIDTRDYSISFRHADKILPIEDPLKLCIEDFIEAIEHNREPLTGKRHILKTSSMLKAIFDRF